MLGQAQTGTGKTAAFAVPMLQAIDVEKQVTQVLVLTPTRELAIQVAAAFKRFAVGLSGVRVAAIYGGQDYQVQFRQLDRGAHIVVGTPGRVIDHMRRGSLKLDALRGLVLDEADEMLRMGFAEEVDWILTQTPAGRQTALFSATLPDSIRRIAQRHLRNPAEITIKQRSATADTVRQRFVVVGPHEKQDVLARVLEAESIDGVLIFVNTKSTTEPLAEFLSSRGHRTAALSSDVAQIQRERIVQNLRSGKVDVIIATDVAARGLDVQRISHVINYDFPTDTESYVHRIGRTGRAGRTGNAILFIHPRGRHLLRRIEQATRQTVEAMEIPTNEVINKRRVTRFHERITAGMAHRDIDTFASLVEQYRKENEIPLEQIAAALAALATGDSPLLLTDADRPSACGIEGDNRDHPRRKRRERPFGRDGGERTERARRASIAEGRRSGKMDTFRIEVGHAHRSSRRISSAPSPMRRASKAPDRQDRNLCRAQHGRHADRDAPQGVRDAKEGKDRWPAAQHLAAGRRRLPRRLVGGCRPAAAARPRPRLCRPAPRRRPAPWSRSPKYPSPQRPAAKKFKVKLKPRIAAPKAKGKPIENDWCRRDEARAQACPRPYRGSFQRPGKLLRVIPVNHRAMFARDVVDIEVPRVMRFQNAGMG